jgi:hypothetical protein
MAAEERLKQAVVATAYEKGLSTGYPHLFDTEIYDLAAPLGVADHETRQVIRDLCDAFHLVEASPGYYQGTAFLLLHHELFDREAAYQQNRIRRYVLRGMGDLDKTASGGRSTFIQFRWDDSEPYGMNEMFIAARVLEGLDLISMSDRQLPAIFGASLTSRGYEALRDERLLSELLPVTPTEDEAAHAPVASDALKTLIVSCEQLLDRRGWKQALVELSRGDSQYRDRDWVNAVREYYAALESGFKYGLREDIAHDGGRALNKLARQAAEVGLIPSNYQALFGYLDSVRSPRSHGGGPKVAKTGEIEIGPAEALLAGNLVRTLLLYLGQRPQVAT